MWANHLPRTRLYLCPLLTLFLSKSIDRARRQSTKNILKSRVHKKGHTVRTPLASPQRKQINRKVQKANNLAIAPPFQDSFHHTTKAKKLCQQSTTKQRQRQQNRKYSTTTKRRRRHYYEYYYIKHNDSSRRRSIRTQLGTRWPCDSLGNASDSSSWHCLGDFGYLRQTSRFWIDCSAGSTIQRRTFWALEEEMMRMWKAAVAVINRGVVCLEKWTGPVYDWN